MFAFRDTFELGPDSPHGVRVEVAFTDASLDLQGESETFPASLSAVVEATVATDVSLGVLPIAVMSSTTGGQAVGIRELFAAYADETRP